MTDANLTTIAALRAGFDSEQPMGPNLRHGGPGLAAYRALRDARSLARDRERRQESQDKEAGGDIRIGLVPEWDEVRKQAIAILAERSKDIEVIVWLTEAETRIGGHDGLAACLNLITDLVREFGANLHPEPEEPDDDRFAALAGLNGVGREGALIQPLRLLSLVPNGGYGQFTLWDVESGQESGVVIEEMREAGPAALRAHHGAVLAALAAARDCDAALSALVGADAPPFNQIIEILDNTERTIRRLGQLEPTAPGAAEEAADGPGESSGAAETAPAAPGRITSREQAFEQLLRIAEYFRKAEPHSPLADSLETLVRRGRLDFLALIEELIPDEATRQAVMKTAGIQSSQ
ncbi:MAG: type VI secretion system protein TssA [Pikeienuella sp.]